MADWTRTTRTVTRVSYELATPSNNGELSKMMTTALTEVRRARGSNWDDDLTVTVGDDSIVLSYEITDDTPPNH